MIANRGVVLFLALIIIGLLASTCLSADSTSIFVVYGIMYMADGVTPVTDAHTIIVTNTRTAVSVTTELGSGDELGKYSAVFIDYQTNNAAQVGDLLTIESFDSLDEIRASRNRIATVDEVLAGKARVDLVEGTHPPSEPTSYVAAQNVFPCVSETIEIFAWINDSYGNPVSGAVVHFSSDRGLADVVTESPDTTDANGCAHAKITTAVPGISHLWADVEWFGYWLTLGPSEGIEWGGASATEATTWGNIKALFR